MFCGHSRSGGVESEIRAGFHILLILSGEKITGTNGIFLLFSAPKAMVATSLESGSSRFKAFVAYDFASFSKLLFSKGAGCGLDSSISHFG